MKKTMIDDDFDQKPLDTNDETYGPSVENNSKTHLLNYFDYFTLLTAKDDNYCFSKFVAIKELLLFMNQRVNILPKLLPILVFLNLIEINLIRQNYHFKPLKLFEKRFIFLLSIL